MLVLTIRTDKPEAEIGLFEAGKKLAYEKWPAHRELAETIHKQIAKNLQFVSKDWKDIEGIVCFKGPGSFTGLRIGLTVGNTLAYSLQVPVVSTEGKDWIGLGISRLTKGDNETVAMPRYGGPVHITKPRK
jgi:tRNA threonylcarbamoyladenosine biosynthesis protein TsaB